jgi:hypothetical protein
MYKHLSRVRQASNIRGVLLCDIQGQKIDGYPIVYKENYDSGAI